MHRLRLASVLLLLPLVGCIEDRLSVELSTEIRADGTCTRRIEYRLERVDPQQPDRVVAIPADDGSLRRMQRLPSGEAWTIEEETHEGSQRIVVEATLPSPNDFDGDFFRAQTPTSPPARNFISAYVDPEEGVYEYREVLRDPISPLAGARLLARQLARQDGEFARYMLDRLGGPPGAPRTEDLRRSFLEQLAVPFADDLRPLRRRPIYGPRERRELEEIVDRLEERQRDLQVAIRDLAPEVPVEELDQAVEAAVERIGDALIDDPEASGLSALLGSGTGEIRFRATLVMPYPIRSANTCTLGDTAVWEFDGVELYGRGFEMKALATVP